MHVSNAEKSSKLIYGVQDLEKSLNFIIGSGKTEESALRSLNLATVDNTVIVVFVRTVRREGGGVRVKITRGEGGRK